MGVANMRLIHLRKSRSVVAVLASALLLGSVHVIPASAGPVAAERTRVASGWGEPNGDKAGTRRVGGPVNSGNVGSLQQVWTAPIVGNTDRYVGTHSATPVVANGVLYTQDHSSNVYAIDLRTGRQLWTKLYHSESNGPTGVAVGDGRVFGGTADSVFALDARTGTQLWIKKITRNENEGIDMAPGYDNGTVLMSTVPGVYGGFYKGNGQGVVWALDGRTGDPKWKFETVPADLWGMPDVNSGGGLWYPPSFDARGDVYLAVTNPAPFPGTTDYPWGQSRPGANLYTNSVVKLDGRTGKLVWYNQASPHDIYDWDLQNSPIVTTAGRRPVVIGSGKAGFVYSYDQATGKTLWKTAVGIHNGHEGDNLLAMNGEYDKLPQLPVEIFPGVLGGMAAPLAVDDTTIYAAVNNMGATWTTQGLPTLPPFDQGTGVLVALDKVTGAIKWQHALDHSPYGASSIVNDVVFTTTYEGKVHALSTKTGAEIWSAQLPAGSNSPVMIDGDTVVAVGGYPLTPDQKPTIVAYRLTSCPRR
jgi:alcohol dehydrogenase (cytochrome c)